MTSFVIRQATDAKTVFCYDSRCAGRNMREFRLSQLSGIVSLIFIAAAFLTSCNPLQPSQGTHALSVLEGAK
jgi:hypothetical protein